jgi:hypothetical protein
MLATRARQIAAVVAILSGAVFTGIVWWLFGDDQLLLSIGLFLAVLNVLGIHFVLAWTLENQEEFAG